MTFIAYSFPVSRLRAKKTLPKAPRLIGLITSKSVYPTGGGEACSAAHGAALVAVVSPSLAEAIMTGSTGGCEVSVMAEASGPPHAEPLPTRSLVGV